MQLLALLAPLAAFVAFVPQAQDERMQWWRDARLGLFVELGLWSSAAGEWNGKPVEGAAQMLQLHGQIPTADYAALLPRFDPARFDARALARSAKDAGMKYVVVTAKHLDGFALFDSKLTDFDVMATPFARDVMQEMAAACAEAGLVLGWHYAIEDWHHPDYLPRGPGSERPWDTRPLVTDAGSASYDRYLHFMKGQLTELLSNYGPIGTLWLDGGSEHSAEEHHADDVVALIRRLQPQVLLDDGLQLPQDFHSEAASTGGGRAASAGTALEVRLRLNESGWKPTAILLRTLVDVVSQGGNCLLQVSPTSAGELPPECTERLADLGRWLAVNGESIYGTTASPFRRLAFGRCTMRAAQLPAPAGKSTLYLHVFDWPKDGMLRLPGLKNKTVGARMLADPARGGVLATRDGADVIVLLPGERPDPVDAVVALTISGPPEVARPVAKPGKDGVVTLTALDAEIHGVVAGFQGEADLQCISFWLDEKEFVTWDLELPRAARFDVAVEYACPPESAGSEVVVSLGRPEQPGPELRLPIGSSGAWTRFKSVNAGALPELAAGHWTLTVKAASKAHDAVANLRSITLSPAR